MRPTPVRALATVLVTGLLALAGCAGGGAAAGPTPEQLAGGSIAKQVNLTGVRLTVGSKEFTEQQILGKVTLYALRAAGAEVTDRTGLSGSTIVRGALENNQIDLYWEYAGTGWSLFLKHTDVLPDAAQQFQATAAEDLAHNKIRWLGPAAFGNQYAIARRGDATGELARIHALSDMARYVNANPRQGSFCGAAEFLDRDFIPMQKTYGIQFPARQTYQNSFALDFVNVAKSSPCNFAEVFTTDARLKSLNLTVLTDDKKFFLSQLAGLVMRDETYRQHPELGKLVAMLGPKLTERTMIELNGKVDLEGHSADQAAVDFLHANGFIG
jgi:osmoprotectant transport system substrate-binding protein